LLCAYTPAESPAIPAPMMITDLPVNYIPSLRLDSIYVYTDPSNTPKPLQVPDKILLEKYPLYT
jgi:hypothetical protein